MTIVNQTAGNLELWSFYLMFSRSSTLYWTNNYEIDQPKTIAHWDDRMLHMADARLYGDLWRCRSGLHLKSGFFHGLVLLDFRQSSFFANLTLSGTSNEVSYNRSVLNLLQEGRTLPVALNCQVIQARRLLGSLQRWLANSVKCR